MKNYFINYFILTASILIFNCSNDHQLNDSSKEFGLKDTQITKVDSYEEKVSRTRNDSLIAAEEEYLKKINEVLKDSCGIVLGRFDTFELGDYGHISIIDSNDLLISFFVFDDLNLSKQEWENLMEGRYKNRNVEISWERKDVFLDACDCNEKIEIAKTFRFKD